MKNNNGSNGGPDSALPGADFFVSGDHGESVEKLLRCLSQTTRCSAAGLLIVRGQRGQVALLRTRPVDDLFLCAMQNRLMSSYQVCLGPAAAEPELDVVVYGEAVLGPYEPPRSMLTAPILSEGRVVGMIAIASVFSEAFCSQDLCTLSAIAAQVSAVLSQVPVVGDGKFDLDACHPDPALLGCQSVLSREQFQSRIRHYVTSICGLARLWQLQDENELPDVLRQDLDAIAENALQIGELLVR
jgi:hypothetical protein